MRYYENKNTTIIFVTKIHLSRALTNVRLKVLLIPPNPKPSRHWYYALSAAPPEPVPSSAPSVRMTLTLAFSAAFLTGRGLGLGFEGVVTSSEPPAPFDPLADPAPLEPASPS